MRQNVSTIKPTWTLEPQNAHTGTTGYAIALKDVLALLTGDASTLKH